jgi:hypothetical protein
MIVLHHACSLCLCCLLPAGADAQTVPGGSDTPTTGGTLPSWEDESFVQVGVGTNRDSAQERSAWAHIRAGFVAGYLSDLRQLCVQHYLSHAACTFLPWYHNSQVLFTLLAPVLLACNHCVLKCTTKLPSAPPLVVMLHTGCP